jgi:glycine amidinotransferase
MTVHSFDEWSPLREVIVGSAVNHPEHARELSFDLFFHDNLVYDRARVPRRSAPIKPRYLAELIEDVEGMAHALASLSIKVHRPLPLDSAAEIRALAWSATAIPPLNIRDNTLIAGDEIIETPPLVRSRYFENQFLAPIFGEYFRAGARWTVMPRPLMTDASFDISYAETSAEPLDSINARRPSPYDVGHEMMFDGAQCLRFGRDMIANVATANHALAVDWLERHLAGRIRVHRVHRLSGNHIDTMVLPLRPGTLLVRGEKVADLLPASLQKWDLIIPPPPENTPRYEENDLILASPYIDLNVLSISPDTVLVNAESTGLIRTLERHRFTVVPVRHRHGRLFGGGLHCFTLDTVRAGEPESYLD